MRNPVRAFAARFITELPRLAAQGLPVYHAWAFGNLRQLGAASELSALYLRWLQAEPVATAAASPGAKTSLAPAVQAYLQIAQGCKALVLKAARAVSTRRALDAGAQLEELAAAWERATALLRTEAAERASAAA